MDVAHAFHFLAVAVVIRYLRAQLDASICPVDDGVDLAGRRWTILSVQRVRLYSGPDRFGHVRVSEDGVDGSGLRDPWRETVTVLWTEANDARA